MSVELQNIITEAIATYDPGEHPMAQRLREIVTHNRMLPLVFDMAECIGIRPDLTMWAVLWEGWGPLRTADGPQPVHDHANRDMAIIIGMERYPELAALLPDKPSPAPQCPSCDGRGKESESRCRVCHGLGWIPERWNDSEHFDIDLTTLRWA